MGNPNTIANYLAEELDRIARIRAADQRARHYMADWFITNKPNLYNKDDVRGYYITLNTIRMLALLKVL